MKPEQSLLAGLVVVCLCGAVGLEAAEMGFSDGNGNLFRVSGESELVLVYEPVTPARSSTGTYTGGERRTVPFSPVDAETLRMLFRKAEAAGTMHIPNREKGSYWLGWNEGEQKRTLVLRASSTEGRAIEEFLRLCLGGIQVTYAIDRGADPWHGLTGTAEAEERSRHIRAVAGPPQGFAPLVASGLVLNGKPLLFRGKSEVVVDGSFFSDLERADATRLSPGHSTRVGTARTDEALRPDFLVPFLLQSQIIITYWHTNADLHLVKEERRDALRCFVIEGEHHYYTNHHNVQHIRFSICANPTTREISVSGE